MTKKTKLNKGANTAIPANDSLAEQAKSKESERYQNLLRANANEMKVEEDESGSLRVVSECLEEMQLKITGTFGVDSVSGANLLLRMVDTLMPNNKDAATLNNVLGLIQELKPRNALEGMLISQMVGTHLTAMDCIARARLDNQTFEGRQLNLNQSTKLMKVFTSQMETLNKHRGNGQHKMVVEHVHVNEGGKAVIGSIEQGVGAKK